MSRRESDKQNAKATDVPPALHHLLLSSSRPVLAFDHNQGRIDGHDKPHMLDNIHTPSFRHAQVRLRFRQLYGQLHPEVRFVTCFFFVRPIRSYAIVYSFDLCLFDLHIFFPLTRSGSRTLFSATAERLARCATDTAGRRIVNWSPSRTCLTNNFSSPTRSLELCSRETRVLQLPW